MLKRLHLFAAVLTIAVAFGAEPPPNSKTDALGDLAYKLDARLIPAVKAVRAGTSTNAKAADNLKSAHGRALTTTPAPEQLAIRIDAIVDDNLLALIKATSAQITHSAPKWNSVSALATISQIDDILKIPDVRAVSLQGAPRKRLGSVQNAADPLMNADKVRSMFGLSGKNQTVGVLSDSVIDTRSVSGSGIVTTGTPPNQFVSGTNPQNSNDLPSTFQVVDPGPGGGTDEGEAMMELIYDVAPGARLAFASAANGQTATASNLIALQSAANCTVTVDDVGFIDEPFFQDGPIAQAISINASAGIPHFSAFGNSGSNGVFTTFNPIDSATDDEATPPTGKNFHNWGINTTTPSFLPINLSAGDDLMIVMQWNQPFSTFNLGSGSQADLDMYLFSGPSLTSTLLTAAASPQGTTGAPKGDPIEILNFVNNGAATTVYLAVNHFHGIPNNVIWLVINDTNLDVSFPSGGVNSKTGFGHPSSRDCIGVGAINFKDIQAGLLRPESFSSVGGVGADGIPFYFDTSGNPFPNGPLLRSAPDISAPDGVDTTTFKKFEGTSCAAPNAAGVAALLLEAAPGTSPGTLASALRSSARDATSLPATPGPDAYTGAGLIDALAALNTLVTPPAITSPSAASGNVASFFSYTITATGSALTFSANNLPPGLTSNGNVISGLPTTAGTFNMTVTATNPVGTVSRTVTVTIGPRVPVQITAQAVAAPNPVAAGETCTFSAKASSDTNLPLTYSWTFGDGTSGSGNPATHVYTSNGNLFAMVTVTDGTNSTGSNVVVVVHSNLLLVSGVTALPHIAGVGQTVSFSVAPMGGSTATTAMWDFGDGTTGLGLAVAHSYATAGTFTATATVSDGNGGSVKGSVSVIVKAPIIGIGKDSDGDGFSDDFETTIGTDPNDPFSSPINGSIGVPLPLIVTHPAIALNFTRSGSDMISFSGTLPITAGFDPTAQPVAFDVSGATGFFMQLNPKGASVGSAPNSFKLQFKSVKGFVPAQNGKFTVKLKGDFAKTLAASGLSSTPVTTTVNLVFSAVFNQYVFQTTKTLKYTNRNGKTATAK